MISFDNYLFHPSAFSELVTEPKLKADKEAGKMSVTTEKELRKIYKEVRHKRESDFESKYTEKGIIRENDGITLFCRLKKKVYKKNVVRVTDEFLTGEPDLSDNEDIMKCEHGVDIKCSWSIFTLPYPDEKLSNNYWWQDQCYMYLTGAKKWTTAYCLMNAPLDEILSEKKRVWYKLGMPEEGYELYDKYIEKCQKIERNMIFDKGEFVKENPGFDWDTKIWEYDIPLNERLVEFTIERDDEAISKIPDVVIKCRKYLNELNNLI